MPCSFFQGRVAARITFRLISDTEQRTQRQARQAPARYSGGWFERLDDRFMAKAVRFAVSMHERLLRQFDELRTRRGYETRSEAIRDLIRDQLVSDGWD